MQHIKNLTIAIILILVTGCSGFFDSPLSDKETGEDINLLIVDMNFFDTRVTYKFIDAKEDYVITSPANITFSGKNANDIVSFSGKKNQEYTTSVGQLELTLDPNVEFSETDPFEFAVNVEIDGYTPMSKGVQFRSVGIKTVEVHLSKKADEQEEDLSGEINTEGGDTTFYFIAPFINGLKSAAADPETYEINYSVTLASILKFKDQYDDFIFSSAQEAMDAYNADPEHFIVINRSYYSDYDPWIDVLNIDGTPQSVIFHLLETGSINEIRVAGTVVADLNGGMVSSSATYSGTPLPDYFGFAQLEGSSYYISGTDTVYYTPTFSYKLVKASDETLCPTGTNITFESSVISSFSITADVYDRQDPPELINTLTFTGNFPETFVVENTPPIPVTLIFRDNNPAFEPIANLEIEDFCSGTATVTVVPSDGYHEYQIVLKAYCPDNPTIAIAPTYSGEFRIANSGNEWQGTSMVGGVVDLLGLPDQEYEYRLLWENEWEYTTMWTEFDANGNYLHDTDSRSITSEVLPDGRIRINIEHEFTQSVCDDMGW